jgi:ubiquitin-protein ligase E3 C
MMIMYIHTGGLFKDFIDSFTKKAFDPAYGLFIASSEQLLTPNPASSVIHEQHLQLYRLFGLIVGKALYEGILSEPQFAGGFLNILLGRRNQLDDLIYLDDAFYKSLINLKKHAAEGGDVDALGLTFSVERYHYGVMSSYDLIPHGSQIPVTSSNLLTYIHRLANYKLNIEIEEQSKAFLSGFRELIPINYIRMFNPHELQLLLSGDQSKIDLTDLRQHVHYGGGYADIQPYIQGFWEILESFTLEEKSAFLKFVTSSPRQPLLGFATLNPKFGIQKVPTYESSESVAKLPTAATCMNLLKLPQYDSLAQLKEKLLYAISSNSGFELS